MISWIQRTFQQHFRIVFGVLLLITIISFVFIYNPSSGISRGDRTTLARPFFGINLAAEADQQRLMGDATLSVNFQTGYMGLSAEQLQAYALQRQAALYLADQLHLPAPGAAELADFLKTLRVFTGEDGQFDARRYASFRDSLKTNPRFSEADVTRVLSDDWRAQRAEKLLGGPGYVLPGEIRNQLTQADSAWTLGVATVDYASFAPGLKASDADLTKFFEENAFRYEIPPRVRASYADFPSLDFIGQVSVTNDEVKAYLDANPERFPKPAEAKDGKAAATPLGDDGRMKAADAALRYERAQRLALKAAADLTVALYEGKIAAGPAFDAFLAAHKLAPKPLAPFTRESGPAELANSPEIADEAFKLGPDRFFSDAVPTAAGAVVLFWQETLPARKPLFAEVREKVSADYLDNGKRERFVELGKTLRTQIEGRLKAGDPFDKAVAAAAGSALKVETRTVPSFTLAKPPADIDESITGTLERLEQGQISEMVITKDKGYLVYAAEKKAPDLTEANPRYTAVKTQLAAATARFNTNAYLAELVAHELKKSEPAAP